ncbi:tryptophan 2,3-dioxygenase family protein [Streptomyces sp. NPDC087440]|uniref:tryptophan 2,3-dioxygenase family protein n=1 Tax=Streptomyces sp. NPDC087440 TaxID=3365790 RepID=UPI0037FB3173
MTEELNYRNYLELDALLSLQKPRSAGKSAAHSTVLSEQFFIIAHQASELWLRQIITDVEAAVDAFTTADDTAPAEWIIDLLGRAGGLVELLHHQLTVLERLPTADFAAFRPLLGTASGAQSPQFHRLAQLLGTNAHEGLLYASLAAWATRCGRSVDELARQTPGGGVGYRLVETLLDLGSGYWRWQVEHVALVARTLGTRPGTGGSSGAAYLLGRCSLPFGELRALRAAAHAQLSAA